MYFILTLLCVDFHAAVVSGLGSNLLSKSDLERCVFLRSRVRETETDELWHDLETMEKYS